MKKIKSMLISMGAITMLSVPVVLAVSCGDSGKDNPAPTKPVDETKPTSPEQVQAPIEQVEQVEQEEAPVSHPVRDGISSTIQMFSDDLQIEDQIQRRQAVIADIKQVAPTVFGAVMTISHTEVFNNLITTNIENISTVVISLRDKLTELLKTVPIINGLIFEKEVDTEGNVVLDEEGNPRFLNVKTDTTGIDKVNGIFNQVAGTEDNIFTKFNNLLDSLLIDAKFILEDANEVTLARLNELYYGRVSVEEVYEADPEIEKLVSDVTGIVEVVKSKDFMKVISSLRSLISNPREFVGVNKEFIAHEIIEIRTKLETFIATKLPLIDTMAASVIGANNAQVRNALSRLPFHEMIYSNNQFHLIQSPIFSGLVTSVANIAVNGILSDYDLISSILGEQPVDVVLSFAHELFDNLNEQDITELLAIFAEQRSISDFFTNNRHSSFKTNVFDILVHASQLLHPQTDTESTPA